MRHALDALWTGEQGQDTTEYALILAFVTITAAVLFIYGPGESLRGMWTNGSNRLAVANTTAS